MDNKDIRVMDQEELNEVTGGADSEYKYVFNAGERYYGDRDHHSYYEILETVATNSYTRRIPTRWVSLIGAGTAENSHRVGEIISWRDTFGIYTGE